MQLAMYYDMTPAEFMDCTRRELDNFLKGRSKRRQDDIELQWDHTRHIMLGSMAPYSKSDLRPDQIMHLPGRDGVRTKKLTPYEEQELREWSELMDSIPFN